MSMKRAFKHEVLEKIKRRYQFVLGVSKYSGELRNGAVQIWRGVVCFSRDFTFRIDILNSISTPHKRSFFIITNVLSLSRDLPHPFLHRCGWSRDLKKVVFKVQSGSGLKHSGVRLK